MNRLFILGAFLLVSVSGSAHPGKRLTFEGQGAGEDCKWACGRARSSTYFQYVVQCNPKHYTWSDVTVKTVCNEDSEANVDDAFRCKRIETGICHHDNHN